MNRKKIGFFGGRFSQAFWGSGLVYKSAVIAAILALSTIWGCAAYRPLPITAESVDAKLQPPAMARLRVLAGEIEHPLLPAVELQVDEGLSPDGAAVLAVLLNPSLRAVRDQRELAAAQLLDAGLLPNPELTYSLDEPTGGNTTGRVSAFGLGLDWNVTPLISRASKLREKETERDAVDLDIAWQEWQVAMGAKAAVYRLSCLQAQIRLLEQVRQSTAEDLARIRQAVVEGARTAGDLNALQAASSRAQERLLALQSEAVRQRLQLLRLMGLAADTPIRLRKDLRLPSRTALPERAALLDGLERRRLDLLALRRGYDSQEAEVRTAVLEQFPSISIGPAIKRDTDNVRTIGFGISIDLPLFNLHQGRIAIERATRQRLYDEYVNRVFEARSDIEQVAAGIRFLNELIAAAQTAAADLGGLEERYRRGLDAGRIDALLYYSALKDRLEAQARVFELQGQLAQAVVALETAAGFYEIPSPTKAASVEPETERRP